MSENYVKCKCQNIFSDEEFTKHYQKCEEFKKYFKDFDTKFGELLKQNSEPKENLLIIRVMLKQYVLVLDKKIKASFNGFSSYPVDVNQRAYQSNPYNSPINFQMPGFNEGSHIQKHKQNVDLINTEKVMPMITIPSNNKDFISGNNNMMYNPFIQENNKNQISVNYKMDVDDIREDNNQPISKKIISYPFDEQFEEPVLIECCQICKDPNIIYLNCLHPMCLACFKDYARKDLHNMKCIACQSLIPRNDKIQLLGNTEYERLDLEIMEALIGGRLHECPNCKEKIVFEKGAIDYNIKNDKNEKLSKEAAEHYAENRGRCPTCKIDFCTGCKTCPYHIGKTCEAAKQYAVAKKCRYDDNVISNKNNGPADDVCSNLECIVTYKTACTKVLKCGHKCWGCKGEKTCPPCIEKTCIDYVNKYDQDSASYCNICFTEGLGNSPVVLLSCNHYVHFKCIETRLKKKWVGPKITFNHCLCPQCNSWVDCPSVAEIHAMIVENKNLYDNICKMALERLKFEGLDKDARLTNPNSKWYKNNLQFALNSLSYYMCYECKKPYFAGLRECGENPIVDNNNPNREYDPKDLICGAHANIAGVAGISECKVHGKDFIEYKCKFCCNIASWFCWGSTHFCEDCHARQCKGDYVSKYSRDKLPKCNLAKCPVKVKHPDNGEEFALGCSVCRNNHENVKNF